MIEKTSNAISTNFYSETYCRTIVLILLLCTVCWTNFTVAQNCASPTVTGTNIDISTDCGATHDVEDGETYNIQTNAYETYTLTICDPNYAALDPQPYGELWDILSGDFLGLTTFDDNTGCASLTYANCTATTDFTFRVFTQHGTINFCQDDGETYELTTSCTPVTFTCPVQTTPIKVTISDPASCCYSGPIPLLDLSSFECADAATLGISYTDCDGLAVGVPVPISVPLPDADGMFDVDLPLGSQIVTYTVTPAGGTPVVCEQNIYVTKSLSCLTAYQVALDANCTATISAAALTYNSCPDMSGYSVSLFVNSAPVTTLIASHIGSLITATVTDPNGNNCGPIAITLLGDQLGPKITCPADITLTCGQSIDPADVGEPTGIFDCSGEVDITYSDSTVGDCDGSVITRTYIARDVDGNQTTCTQLITLDAIDYGAIICPSNYTGFPGEEPVLSCEDYSLTNLPTTAETGGMMVNGIVLQEGMYCEFIISKTDEIIQVCDGTFDIMRSWKISDWCPPYEPFVDCIQIIKVKDITGPTGIAGISSFQNVANQCVNNVFIEAATFTDNCGNISSTDYTTTLTLTGTGSGTIYTLANSIAVFNNVPMGDYTITQCAKDACGNEGCVTSEISLTDNLAPVAVCSDKSISLNGSENVSFCASAITGSYDNCNILVYKVKRLDADASVPFTDCIDLTCDDSGEMVVVRLRVYDLLGTYGGGDDIPDEVITDVRFGECEATIDVQDKSCPVCPTFPDVNITCNQVLADGVGGYIADPNTQGTGVGEFNEFTDNCDLFLFTNDGMIDAAGDPITLTTLPTCGGTVYQNWILTDPNNATCSQSCQQRIIIAPTAWDGAANIVFPDDVTINCDEMATLTPPTVINIDQVCGNLIIDNEDKLHTSINGYCSQIIRTWKVIDVCALDAVDITAGIYQENQIIYIEDSTDPTFDSTPSNVTVGCNNTFAMPDLPTASDDCDNSVTVTSDQNTILGIPDATNMYTTTSGVYTVTYTATDECGNTATSQITVTVGADVAPVIACNTIAATELDLGTDCILTLTSALIAAASDVCDGILPVFIEQIADPNNPSTIVPATSSLTFALANVGTVHIQAWTTDSNNNSTSTVCSFEITDNEGCACGTGIAFDLNASIAAPNCEVTATISNLVFNGSAANASDYTVSWNQSSCGNSLTCTGSGGTYTATVSHNTFSCPSVSNTVIVNEPDFTLPVFLSSPGSCAAGDMNGFALFSIRSDGSVIADFTGYTVSWFDASGNPISTCTNIGTGFCNDQPSGDYLLEVTDPNGCASEMLEYTITCTSPRIAGVIANEEGDELSDVTVVISDGIDPFVTDVDGSFVFDDLNMGSNYTVTPEKNINPLNGVTTFDLVLISQHILGIQPLTSPYKLIAADANGTSTVTTLDLVKLQRLILGIDADFDQTESWKFIKQDFLFPNPQDPFASPFPEIFPISGLANEMLDVDFVGVKIGDVNCTATPNNMVNAQTRNEGTLHFEIQDQTIEMDTEFEVNFTAKDFEEILGYQFTLQFDTDRMEFVAFKKGTLQNMQEENFGLNKLSSGLITSNWFSSTAISKKNKETLFTLVFKAKRSGDLANAFDMTNGITSKEAYQKFGTTVKQLDAAIAIIGSKIQDAAIELFQNSPNPFKDHTNIQFYLPEAKSGSILIFDYSGKIVMEINEQFTKGINEVTINKNNLKTTGVLFYQLEIENFTATKKMLMID